MAKRFSDTDKWKKPFIRSLPVQYKLLWFYILDDCDHAGIWHVDFDVAKIRTGVDLNADDAINVFGDKIKVLNGGSKWFISDFIEFQYGSELNPKNKVHASAIDLLKKNGVSEFKGLASPLQGAKDKDKDKDKVMDTDKDTPKSRIIEIGTPSETWFIDSSPYAHEPVIKVYEDGLDKYFATYQNGFKFKSEFLKTIFWENHRNVMYDKGRAYMSKIFASINNGKIPTWIK